MFSIFSEPPDYTPYKLPQPSNQLVDSDRGKYGLLEGEEKKPLGRQ
jgi:hypothetical protein